MNSAQRSRYFAELWPAACRAQGWNVRDDARRRAVTFQATGKNSSTECGQLGITAIFKALQSLAQPHNFALALLATKAAEKAKGKPGKDPSERAANAQKAESASFYRAKIRELSFADAYINAVATSHLRAIGKSEWKELPADRLEKIFYTLVNRRRSKENAAHKPGQPGQPPYHHPRKDPWHQRHEGKIHADYMRRLQVATVYRLEEISAEMEKEAIADWQEREICHCHTCLARREGERSDPPPRRGSAKPGAAVILEAELVEEPF